MESDMKRLRVENSLLKKRMEEMNMRSQLVVEEEHGKLAAEMSKLLKVNQELRNKLEKSNNNVESVSESIVENDKLKH